MTHNLETLSINVEQLAGINILVVDDDTDTRDLLSFVLRQEGAQVVTAENGFDALNELRRAPFDVLISDIGMPEMDGFDLIQQVRALPPNSNGFIPAIALTAYARIENRVRVLSSSFNAYMTKPANPNELITTVANLARQK
ncbi:MAG: hypothetical protein NVSMB56_17990 [Pyrinomonadaceae bacterium]